MRSNFQRLSGLFLLCCTLFFLVSCNIQPLANFTQVTVTPTAIPEVWAKVRAAFPTDIPVYLPTNMPSRFHAPELYEMVTNDKALGPHFTVGYTAPTSPKDVDTVVFIMNFGQGSWNNTPAFPSTTKSITVDGTTGELDIIPDTLGPSYNPATFFWATWQKQGQSYQIKAISTHMTEEDIMQIIKGLVPITR